MAIKYLYTKDLLDTANEFKIKVNEFHDAKMKVKNATTTLLDHWSGKSRNSFEKEYKLIFGQLSDIEDQLEEIYKAIIDSVTAYEEADDKVKQKIEGQ